MPAIGAPRGQLPFRRSGQNQARRDGRGHQRGGFSLMNLFYYIAAGLRSRQGHIQRLPGQHAAYSCRPGDFSQRLKGTGMGRRRHDFKRMGQ